jgi:hypothetical protein
MRLSRVPAAAFASLLLAITPLLLHAQSPRPEPVGLRPDAPTFAKHGPYWVGAREFTVKTTEEGRMLPATLWYPALNPGGVKEACVFTYLNTYHPQAMLRGNIPKTVTIQGRSIIDAPPDASGGPYPLIVFLNGGMHSRFDSSYIKEHLASYGFMVLGVDHPAPGESRPSDLVSAVDFARKLTTPAGVFSGLINTEHAAGMGVFDGADKVLIAGGASSAFEKHPDICIKAVITMNAMNELTEDPDDYDFSKATLPSLVLLAPSFWWPGYWGKCINVYKALPSARKSLVTIKCVPDTAYFTTNNSGDTPPEIYRPHDLVNHFTTAFLLDVLKGDKDAHKALLPEAVKFEEIQYTTTWK